ncbi:hypothetical protein DRE_06775 [Drechslerella stenobrocha 248]|uniref:J domain-containing protein n=1 Tax=Drechslerella stenobrocha 248 TaxID=1043628 RepID=W7HWS0_9PEZI|nr:hypothetical protein DRE_06775 [Drechslerella stenobrocha 248]
MDTAAAAPGIDGAYAASTARKGKLRLKSKRRSHRPHDERRRTRSRSPSSRRTRSVSPTAPSHRKKQRQPTVAETDDPSLYDDVYLPGQNGFKYKDPEAAFQESLFEAMADDEGASYWEGVYGQPIHVYSRPQVENEKGELEAMTDEEYAAYVRRQMYEKSSEYLEAEHEKHQKERERARRKAAKETAEWERRERERLVREKERRQRKSSERTKKAWRVYTDAWENATKKDRLEQDRLEIPWPVESGRRSDISKEAVESFFQLAAGIAAGGETSERKAYADVLRLERVRWHPDKALQRWGREQLSDDLLKGITAVFQIVDSLWATEREGDKR